jgi:plasmid stabilization system protein ParE
MRHVRFLDEASEELEAIATYYDNHHPGLAAAFVAEARKTRKRIA